MGKKFKFEFEKGGTLIADACTQDAPNCVRIFEDLCPHTFVVYHCCAALLNMVREYARENARRKFVSLR